MDVMSNLLKYGLYLLLISALFVVIYIVLIYYSVLSYERQIFITNGINDSVISVFKHGNTGVVIAGYHYDIPDTNYVKIKHRYGINLNETLHVCWEIDRYTWKMVIDGTEIIENRLDTLSFQFKNQYEKDERDIPNIRAFVGNHCAAIIYLGPKIIPEDIADIEAKWKLRIGSDRYRKEF